jgi:hypothetical protein
MHRPTGFKAADKQINQKESNYYFPKIVVVLSVIISLNVEYTYSFKETK